MRRLVKFWRGCGLLALMYLDDGIGGNLSRESAKNISVQVRKDLASASFTCDISTTSARVLSGVPNTEKQMKARGRFGRVLLLFRGV